MSFIERFVSIVLEVIQQVFTSIFDLLFGKESKPLYPATFGSETKLLSSRSDGFCLSGRSNLSQEHSFRNAMIVGGTGAGKTSTILLPSLYTMTGSFVVHDPAGELYQKSAGDLQRRGYAVKQLNFARPDHSDGYNPLSRAQTSSEINKIATLLIRTTLGGSSKDQFWNFQSITLLSLMIHLVKSQGPKYHNLASVRYFLSIFRINPDEIERFFSRLRKPSIEQEYRAFLSLDQKVQAGVIATCLSALQLFTDEQVAQITSFDSIDFSEFRTHPTALFIQNPVSDQRYYATLSALFLEQLFARLLERPTSDEHSVFALIDEAASLYLPSLPMLSANVRKYRVGLLLALQDFSQLIDVYGKAEAETIRSNCFAKLYFTGQSLHTAEELEKQLGLTICKDDKDRELVRPLITRDEIRTMPSSQGLLVCGNYHPIVLKLSPYYHNTKLVQRSRLRQPSRPYRQVATPRIPSITSSDYEHNA